jgi:2-oxoglutarate dehydrogenase E2 component (dihydrolipoamide succinyltransferase)
MGESIMEGTILKWYKKAGDKVERDETLLEISTDKVDTEVQSPEEGIIFEILYEVNQTVEVGKVIAKIETDVNAEVSKKEDIPQLIIEEKKEVQIPENIINKKSEEFVKSEPNRFYSPLVLNIAGKEGIGFEELNGIKGTGLEGRVTKKDLLNYIEFKKSNETIEPAVQKTTETFEKVETRTKTETQSIPVHKPESIIYSEDNSTIFEFDNIRQKMAEHMIASITKSPHVNTVAEVDLSNVEKIRKELMPEFERKEGFKLTYMPFICSAVVKALKDFPLINSVIDDSNIPFKAVINNRINIGIAVAMDNGGLIVPVIKDADNLNLTGIARAMNDLGKRAKIKKLTLDEIQGGTFTISNYGVFGNIIGTMIINQPQIGILGVGAVKKRPVVLETKEGDFVVIKPIMYLTLSFDHRLIDGALGGSFVMRIAKYLEEFKL